jgi:hypothetical protein
VILTSINRQIVKQHAFGQKVSMLFLFLLVSIPLFGQFTPDEVLAEEIMLDSLAQSQDTIELPTEEIILESFFLNNIHQLSPFRDSMLDYRFLHYNPVFEQEEPYLFLGNNGSAAIPATQISKRQTGFDLGIHSYDLYSMSLDSFRWYRTNLPFSDLYFSSGPTEDEFRVKAKFTSNLSEKLNFNIDFERILENGYYLNQATKQSMISIGFWHKTPDQKSNTFITYVGNVHQEAINGGIKDTLSLSEPLRKNIPVSLSGAISRLQKNHFAISNYYRLSLKPDSLADNGPFKFDLFNQLSYESGFFKYFDKNTGLPSELTYYSTLLVDDIGLRHYLTFDKLGVISAVESRFRWNARLKAGIGYNLWWLSQEMDKVKRKHELFAKGDLFLSPLKGLLLNGDIKFHFGSFLGDFRLDVNGQYTLNEIIRIEGRHLSMLSHPGQIEQTVYINSQLVIDNDFRQINTNQSEASIALPAFGFKGGIKFYQINNLVYFDREDLFTQLDIPVNILAVHARQHLNFRNFNLNLRGYYYVNNNDIIDIPQFQLESRLYFKGHVLKRRLLLNSGLEFKLLDGFYVPGYQGLVGHFYPQSDIKSSVYPLLNIYLGFQINTFRFFVRSENILNAFTGDVHYLALMHPQNDFRMFRIGALWQFVN